MSHQSLVMLSIDDKTMTTDLDRAGYRSMGVIVRTATTFAEAEQLLSTKKIDIVVINHDYDKIDGIGICKHLKQQPQWQKVPVVITSINANAQTKKKIMEADADLFVELPIPRQYFIEKIKKILEHSTRSNQRLTLASEATLEGQGASYQLKIADVSATGILLTTGDDIPVGEKFLLSFKLPGNGKPVRVHGEVVRQIAQDTQNPEKPYGIGVKFVDFDSDGHERLVNFIEKNSDDAKRMIYYL